MTRGRTPEWADTQLAQWLRRHLEGRDKAWLIDEIAQRNDGNRAAAAALVNRWTFRGEPAHAGRLRPESIALVAAIFGEDPPGAADSLASHVHGTVELSTGALLNRIATLDATQAEQASEIAAIKKKVDALGAVLQERLGGGEEDRPLIPRPGEGLDVPR